MNKNNYTVNNEHAEIQNIQKEKQYILTLEEGIKLQTNINKYMDENPETTSIKISFLNEDSKEVSMEAYDEGEQEEHEIADNGNNAQTVITKERNQRLIEIIKNNNLDINTIREITGRSKIENVEKWLRDEKEVPEKALREIERYIENKEWK